MYMKVAAGLRSKFPRVCSRINYAALHSQGVKQRIPALLSEDDSDSDDSAMSERSMAKVNQHAEEASAEVEKIMSM